MACLLIIEDEEILAKNIARHFEKLGHTAEVVHDGVLGVAAAERLQPDVVIVDFQLPGMDGLEVIRALRRFDDPPRIVMVTGLASVALAVDAMKAGSMDLLTKPVTLGSLRDAVDRALAERGERRALEIYRQRDAREASLDALVGESPAIQGLREMVRSFASVEPTDHTPAAPILIFGETGTGKELVARACHQAGPRAKGPFVEVNCAALPAHLIEGELFGHEKGAFTDAHTRKTGLIEAADGGTLLLDEIGELDLALQAKLLRVLENLRVRRVGALQERQVNVRIVAATNRDLDELVRAGKFRSDLMYRLKVFQITIAPLRERPGDIPLLARHFLGQLAQRYARGDLRLEHDALAALQAHDWPGNVRELRNVLERAALLQRTPVIRASDLMLPAPVAAAPGAPHAAAAPAAGSLSLEAVEREHLVRALEACRWNVSQAARKLSISRDTLRYRMERHGLQR
ncbi:MAG: sigma-54-dependent Fis family transcriptional regulator [Rhodoferax sp.]|jgi:DNA-binding NtrC family response regulator|nr:sigma-54-dependent Fis family transcriptional regulator [Rhodoferax sp.]